MSLFGGSSSASSDPFAMFAAIQQAQSAAQQTALGYEWLGFAREQFAVGNERQAKLDELTGRVTEQQLADAARASQWAGEDRARYRSVFQPLEDRFIEKASNWDSAAAQAKAAEEARADVLVNADQQRQANARQMAARGINPTSGAWAGIDRAQATETSLAAAGAQNAARNQLRKEAVALQGDALNIGRGLPSQALDALGAGVGAGNHAAANQRYANQSWLGNQAVMASGFEGAGGLFKGAGSAWGSIYDNRTSLLNRQDELSMAGQQALFGGFGGAVGLGLGMYRSDKDAKTNKRKARGILKAVKNMTVEKWRYKKGEGDEGEHVGPYAQDFQKATGLGDGKNINIVDAIGVTMGAVKELAEKVDRIGNRTAARPKSKSIFKKAA
jgi:hypothetical protein